MHLDVLLLGGTIYDGSGSPPLRADIGISGDSISLVGDLRGLDADEILDVTGLAMAPGFIDTHAHSEFTLLADPRAEGKLLQGITTEINGNCGMSAAPLIGDTKEKREPDMREYGITEEWDTFEEYFEILRARKPALNVATLAGHGNIRGSVVGYINRTATEDEMTRMKDLLVQCLRAGALGMSTGLIYPPGIYTPTEEIVELASCGRQQMGDSFIYTSHMRSEGDQLIESVEETLRIGREAGVRVHISHIKTGDRKNWQKIDKVVALLEEARDEGIMVTCDRYPYTAGSTDLDAVLPAWVFEGGNDAELNRLTDPETRTRIMEALPEGERWSEVMVSSVVSEQAKWMEGMRLSDIAQRRQQSPQEAVLDILVEERLRVGAIFHSMSETNLQKFLSLPYTMVGSDSSARSLDGPTCTGKPHPRGFGTFPRYLRMFKDSLPEAVHKATELPARTFRIPRRGRIQKDFFADLVVFDPAALEDTATYADPFNAPRGILYVMVNGRFAVRSGSLAKERTGRVVSR